MCVYSMIGDHYTDKFKYDPDWEKWFKQLPVQTIPADVIVDLTGITRQEFDNLKKQVEDMKRLLERALKYDEENKEPRCETDAKVALLKKVAEAFGVDLTEILKK